MGSEHRPRTLVTLEDVLGKTLKEVQDGVSVGIRVYTLRARQDLNTISVILDSEGVVIHAINGVLHE